MGTRSSIVILSDSEGSMDRNARCEAYLKCFTWNTHKVTKEKKDLIFLFGNRRV